MKHTLLCKESLDLFSGVVPPAKRSRPTVSTLPFDRSLVSLLSPSNDGPRVEGLRRPVPTLARFAKGREEPRVCVCREMTGATCAEYARPTVSSQE